MGGPDDKAPKEPDELNYYRLTLQNSHDTVIPNARDGVYNGVGDPGSPIASAIQGGGWECPEADRWVKEMLAHTKGVLGAFDDARDAVQRELRSGPGAPERVPAHDWRGNAWLKSWHMRQHNY